MAHINIQDDQLPGIIGLLKYRITSGYALSQLAEVLLRGDSPLTRADRELIASSVSHRNDCHFCHSSHGAAAAAYLGEEISLLNDIKNGSNANILSEKMKALMNLAHKVQEGGKYVKTDDIVLARNVGATDLEIHDTVLIAAAFCMYNRYVDGLATWAPESAEAYIETGQRLAKFGYLDSVIVEK